MSISFQGRVPQAEKERNTRLALIFAPALASSDIISETLMNKEIRQDSFIKTAKEGAKIFTADCRNIAAGFCKYILRNDKLANKVYKMASNDKRIFAIGMAVSTLISFGILKSSMDFASKFQHRKD